jgi:hypothetical protein
MIKPVGYGVKVQNEIYCVVYPTKERAQEAANVIFQKGEPFPLFTIDQVLEIAREAYAQGVIETSRLSPVVYWEASEIKAELDAIAAQAAGGEV